MNIRAHHQRGIDRLTDAYRADPRFLALIIGGSVAKGFARHDSDVDFLIVATDEEFERRKSAHDPRNRLAIGQRDPRITEFRRLRDQLVRMRCSLQKGEVAFAVKLEVFHGREWGVGELGREGVREWGSG